MNVLLLREHMKCQEDEADIAAEIARLCDLMELEQTNKYDGTIQTLLKKMDEVMLRGQWCYRHAWDDENPCYIERKPMTQAESDFEETMVRIAGPR